jgi:hypothetical protein
VTRGRVIGVVAASLVVHGLLLAGWAVGLPGPLRLAAAFAVLVLMPGWAFVLLGARPPGGAWLAAGWVFGLGVAWNAALVLLAHAAGLSFLALLPWTPLTSVLPWGFVGWRASATSVPRERGLALAAVLAVLLAAAFAAMHAVRFGPPLGYLSDTPDHVGTLRRMLESGTLFPVDAFFRDAGLAGADPRKGLWHGIVALLARLARLDPLETWRWLGALIAPFFVLNVAALGFLCRGSTGAALAAWVLVLTYGGGPGQSQARQAVYATRVADQLALAAAVAVLADLGRRARATRLAAVGLGFAAVAAHVYSAIQFALVFPALGLGLLIRDRRLGPEARRLAGTVLLLGVVCLPYLLARQHQAYAPANVIHTEPQGLTWLAGSSRVVSIEQLWGWMGLAWVLVPLSWPWLWLRGRGNVAVLFLLTSSVAVALTIYDPPVVALLQPRLGYLLMRMVWMVPFAALVAWFLPELAAIARERGSGWARAGAAALLVLALASFAPTLRDGVQALRGAGSGLTVQQEEDPRRWQADFDWMAQHLDPGCVVLSDPATSYLVPMMTGRYVAALVDQHSSPNDSLGLTRILDARDALDPYGTWKRMREVVRRYGASVIVLNDRFEEPLPLDFWAPRHPWFLAERARLDAHPEVFPRLRDTGDLVVYGLRRAALDTLSGPVTARPCVEAWAPGLAAGAPVARGPRDRAPQLIGFTLATRAARPGDNLIGVARWRAAQPATAGAWRVSVRLDRGLPGGFTPPAFLGRPAREVLEWLRHERYGFRADHLPARGDYGVDLWKRDEVVLDSFALWVPPDVAEGTYQIEVRMHRQPHYPNLRLSEWFFDRDRPAGEPGGTLRVSRGVGGPDLDRPRNGR